MIELYTWSTPNGRKIPIMLEEVGLPYTVKPIDLGKNEQFDPAFLKISPNNKIPAIVDPDGPSGPLTMFESGAILVYLAEKTGKLLAPSGGERYRALEWLNWQIGGMGPMFGQLGFFAIRSEEKSELAIKRFTEECARLLRVMDRRTRRKRVSCRPRLHHRRHRLLHVDEGRRDLSRACPRPDPQGMPVSDALARDRRRARAGSARHGRAEGVSAFRDYQTAAAARRSASGARTPRRP